MTLPTVDEIKAMDERELRAFALGVVAGATQAPSSNMAAVQILPGHLLGVDDVAALASMTRDAVYKAAERGEIPGTTRVGRRLRFKAEGITKFLSGRHVGSRHER